MKRGVLIIAYWVVCLFIIISLFVAGKAILEPHGFYEGIRMVWPAAVLLIIGTVVSTFMVRKKDLRIVAAVQLITLIITFSIFVTTSTVVMADARFLPSMAIIGAIPILIGSTASMIVTLFGREDYQ